MNYTDKSNGSLLTSMCKKCNLAVWPPNKICSRCLGPTEYEECAKDGRIIEFSKKEDVYFCIAEFSQGVRIMGRLYSKMTPKIGQTIQLTKAEPYNGGYNFEFRVI